MSRFYNFLAKLDELDYRTSHYEPGWNLFTPKKVYKVADILYLLWFGIAFAFYRGFDRLVYDPLNWLNEHLSVKKPTAQKEEKP